jgi:hypothetical protein
LNIRTAVSLRKLKIQMNIYDKVMQINPKFVDNEPIEKSKMKEKNDHVEIVKKADEANQNAKGDDFELLKLVI